MEKLKALKTRFLPPQDVVPPKKLKLNNDTGMLKVFACLLMLSDHMGKMIFSNAYKLAVTGEFWSKLLPKLNIYRAVGRLAMPMFAYCIAVGCNYTRNIWKYAFRLLIMGILVHPLYQEAMGHVPFRQFVWHDNFFKELYAYYYENKNLNILFTLTLGTLIIGCYRHKKYVGMALSVLLTVHLHNRIDYGYEGVFLIILFYAFLDHPAASFVSVVLFMLNWCVPRLFIDFTIRGNSEIYAIPSLLFIYFPMRKRLVKLPKWFFYGFYPAHLFLIYLLLLKK